MNKYQIVTPCTERWENMAPSKNGRFCDLCQKEVIDLTGKNRIAKYRRVAFVEELTTIPLL